VLLALTVASGCSRNPDSGTASGSRQAAKSEAAKPAGKEAKLAAVAAKLFDQTMAKIERLKERESHEQDPNQYVAAAQEILHEAESLLEVRGLTDQQRAAARKAWFEAAFDLAQLQGSAAKPLLPKLEQLYQEAKQQGLSEQDAAEIDQYRIWVNLLVKRETARPGQAIHKELLSMVDQFLADHGNNPAGVDLLMTLGRSAEMSGEYEAAKGAYQRLAQRYPTHPAAALAKSELSKLKLIGQPMELSGPTLDGKRFDIAQWRGKLVLVDFWATWCGPCVMEIPHMMQVYQRYHDKGLEIVGVSLDHSREQLEQFIKERQIPWQQVFYEPDQKDSGWQNPLAVKYDVTAIPMIFLVDREGKVAHIGLRGERIERAVRQMLGDSGAESQPQAD